MYIAISAVLILIIGILLYVSKSLRLDLTYRKLHSRYVCFTAIYSVLGVVGFSLLLLGVNTVLSIPAIRNGLFRIVPDKNTAAAFYWIVTLLVNILFLTLFDIALLLIKKLWIPRVINNDTSEDYLDSDDANIIERFFHSISNIFYDETSLKPASENIGVWIRAMKNILGIFLIAESVILTLVLGINISLLPEGLLSTLTKSLYMIPMASYILLNQIEIFLCADRRIDEGLIDTEEIDEKVIGDYSPLIKLYESLFGEKALIAYYIKGEGDFTHSLYAGIDEGQLKKSKNPELLNAIYRNLENGVEHVSTKYVDCLVDLINGENIAVVDSMCGEFNIYFLSYLQHQLLLGKKALVICDTEQQVSDMIKKYNELFILINRVSSLWRVGCVEDMQKMNVDILVCTEETIFEERIKHKYNDFFEKIENVVLMDAYGIICRDKAFLTRLFNYINSENIQFVFCIPENNPDIKTVIEDFIKEDVVVYENYNETTNTCIMYWRQEPAYKSQFVMSTSLINDLGLAYTISLIAAKFDVLDINIQAPDSVPIYSHRNTATGEYAKVLSEQFFKRESLNIDSIIKVNNSIIFKSKELAFNVLYDENNNLLSLTNMWLSYGGKTCSMLHMISRPYMLRDYFAYNLSEMYGKLSDVKMFVPIKVLNIRAAALAFLIKTRNGVTVDEIMEFAHLNGIKELSAEKVLERLLGIIFESEAKYRVYDTFSFDEYNKAEFKNETYIYSHVVKMTSQTLYDRLCALTSNNAILIDRKEQYVLAMNKDDIFNYYLPDQCYSFNGIRYHIENIQDGEIYVSKEETVIEEKDYTSLYDIVSVENKEQINGNKIVSSEDYSINFFVADVTREIRGYLEYSNGIDLSKNANTKIKPLVSPIRESKKVNCLEIDFKYAFGESYDKIAALLVVLIKGALETLLPKNYKDILVFSNIDKDSIAQVEMNDIAATVEEDIDKRLLDILPNVRCTDFEKNTRSEIIINIVEYSKIETGALYAIAVDLDRMLIIIKRYVEWVLARGDLKKHYIYFGLGELPSIFAINETANWLNNITNKVVYPEKIIDGNYTIAASRYCAFCGRAIITSGILLKDGRAMCDECAKHRANTKREVKVLLRRAYNIIESKYGVQVPPGIKIKFASLDEINRDVGNDPNSGYVTLGYYDPSIKKIKVARGGPEVKVLATLVHELTHAWQHEEKPWLFADSERYIMYYEGHAMYTEIECMYALKETAFAQKTEADTEARTDEYGEGFKFWKEFIKDKTDKNVFHHIDEIKEK